jgi:hypothetical protein
MNSPFPDVKVTREDSEPPTGRRQVVSSGKGPVYVSGPVRVIGDGDGDGDKIGLDSRRSWG